MKISRGKKINASYTMTKKRSIKLLSLAILASATSSVNHASDLEIYQAPEGGKVVITMMLDNSISMSYTRQSDSINNDYGITGNTYQYDITQPIYDNNGIEINGSSVSYRVYYRVSNDKLYFDRISRLKMALIPMFANPKSDEGFGAETNLDKYMIGFGSFFGDSREGGGKIDAPAMPLTLANRKELLGKLVNLKPETFTPIANAYAEAGAYMLGTNTQAGASKLVYEEMGYSAYEDKNNGKGNDKKQYVLYECDDRKSDLITRKGYTYYPCKSNEYDDEDKADEKENLDLDEIGIDRGDIYVTYEEDDKTYYLKLIDNGDDNLSESGFSRSEDSTKNATTYNSPIDGSDNQCNGYGIYFLTDGEPNVASDETINLMNNSLSNSTLTMGNSCNSDLANSGARFGNASGWQCIGEYGPLLNSISNSKKTAIKTATVGFGSVYQTLSEIPKVTKNVRLDNGTVEAREVYNCDGVSDRDAKNLCKLGEKGYEFGEGGFYYTKESKDISDSVKSFAKSLGDNVIQPISTGTMSVPLDSLSGLKSRGFAYLPILEPVPRSPRLWNGNLKKYKVKDATLFGADNNPVFSNTDGEFAKNTHDLWNTITDSSRIDTLRPDQSRPQVGGAYQKVFENATPPTTGDRNLFVDSGSALVNLTVDVANVPNNFDALTSLSGNDSEKNDKKRALLNFMGYPVSDIGVTDGVALDATKNKSLKNIGGVLHSIPQLITQKVNIDGAGKFDVSSRKDYVLYGSMDGALHMLDDSTGEETFTFIPKQILELQPDAISGEGSAVNGSYPYGVDAPWLTYASYTVKATTEGEGESAQTTNSYEASQSFALGGLRMGGSMYYALDVSNPKSPKMIYSVGSNYANRQKGLTTDVRGVANGISAITTAATATADQKAYARMGQSWGKPTLGYVKSGGKKVMVSFLPGGYDDCYENPNFKLSTVNTANLACSNKASAQGNAMYMVQVGEVEIDATSKEETVKTSTNNGNLLWWASNSDSNITAASTATSPSLQYSQADDLKHSVVTQVRALDRNYDGLIDHIYFADLGGQVWRADINNNADTANFKVDRVVKVLDVSDQASDGDAPPRIYERPLITFHNGTHAYIDDDNQTGQYSGVQAIVTVGTGDRSSPVSATRSTPNAIYSVIDKDVSRNELFYYGTETAPTLNLRTPVIKVAGTSTRNDKLKELTFTDADLGTNGIRAGMQNNTIQGWYMPLTHWLDEDAKIGGKYKLKMFNEPDAIAGVLISSSFNPDEGQAANTCSAGVIGETQRERTCLPYGVCLDNTKSEILTSRSSYSAGLGIVDNIVSQYNDTSTFTSLKNYCEGDDCEPEVICTGDDCSDVNQCVGPNCDADAGVNVDQRINPLSWMEH
nr:PilC/PilY family type IV pilus protein [Psychrobacter sp. Pi2-1]